MIFALLVYSVTYLVTRSTLLGPLRQLGVQVAAYTGWLWLATLVYCPPCAAFWVGLALGLFGYWPLGNEPLDVLHAALCAVPIGHALKLLDPGEELGREIETTLENGAGPQRPAGR